MKIWIGLLVFFSGAAQAATGTLFNSQSGNYGGGVLRVEDDRLLAIHGRDQALATMVPGGQNLSFHMVESKGFAFIFFQRPSLPDVIVAASLSDIRRSGNNFYISARDMVPQQIFDLRGSTRGDVIPNTGSRFALEKTCKSGGSYQEIGVSEQVNQSLSLTFLRREDGKQIGQIDTHPVAVGRITKMQTTDCQVPREFNVARPAGMPSPEKTIR